MNSSAEDVRPWHPLVPYAHPIRYPTRTGRAHERRGQEKSRADHHLGRRAMGKFSLRAASHPLFTKLGFFFSLVYSGTPCSIDSKMCVETTPPRALKSKTYSMSKVTNGPLSSGF